MAPRRIIRSILSVIVGYVIMAGLVGATSALLMVVVTPGTFRSPDGQPILPGFGWYALNLGWTLLYAGIGGYVLAWIAQRAPMNHALALCVLMAVMSGTMIAIAPPEAPPAWWTAGELIIGWVGLLGGAYLRVRRNAAVKQSTRSELTA